MEATVESDLLNLGVELLSLDVQTKSIDKKQFFVNFEPYELSHEDTILLNFTHAQKLF